MGGMVLPMPANRDMFIVRAKDYGLDESSVSQPADKVRYDFVVTGTEVRVTRDGNPRVRLSLLLKKTPQIRRVHCTSFWSRLAVLQSTLTCLCGD